MSCYNISNCIESENVNQCQDLISFNLGIAHANKTLTASITGRSNRVYNFELIANLDGLVSFNPNIVLPIGYISVFATQSYQVWFTDETKTKISLLGTDKCCFSFKVVDYIGVTYNTETSEEVDLATKDIYNIEITEKGNGDLINHGYPIRLKIISFYDANDNGRNKNIFFNTLQNINNFILNCNFNENKYTGTLVCTKL